MEWKYISNTKKSNGYEDVMDRLLFLTEKYKEVESDEIINEVVEIYKNKDIFPITYYNDTGVKEEILKCHEKNIIWEGDILNIRNNQGNSLLRFLFPNQMTVTKNYTDTSSMLDKFNSETRFKSAVRFALKYDKANPIGILRALRMIGGQTDTNFSTMKAQAIYERYCPPNGIIYDYSAGFGGRMLGALTSKNNYKYIGVEPNTETYTYLLNLGKYIENALNKTNTYEIIHTISENYKAEKDSVNFAFSSPPYFDLEKYSDEDTQSYIKYKTIDQWFDGYVIPTLCNIRYMLKSNSFYAVNIADFGDGRKGKIEIVDRWIKESENVGFTLEKQIYMKVQRRRGDIHHTNNDRQQTEEGIYVFKKN